MSDANSLDGIWELVRAELAGEKAPEMLAAHLTLELAAGAYAVRLAGKVADHGTYVLDPEQTPPALTLTGTEGPNAGRTIPGIFQLVGDRLRVCYGLDGTTPTAFATAAGTQHYLATYRHQKR